MNKAFVLGISIAVLSILIGSLANNWFLSVKVSGMTAIVSTLLAGIFMGIPSQHPSKTASNKLPSEKILVKGFILIAIPNFILLFLFIALQNLPL